ncbi:tetratricopeptide repeat protein [bacterium]|jgi:Tfp pilus assembly protein PilF|nr:tetratricopeptide repeat protein [bacterium]
MDTNRAEEMTEQAARSLAAGEPLRALALADQLVSINRDDATARVIRSHALLATNSVEEAMQEANIAVLLDNENEDAQMALALAAWRGRQILLAQHAFERAIQFSGQRSLFEAQYAWFQSSELNARSAEKLAERTVGRSPDCAVAWASLGLAQFRLNKGDEAARSLRRALEIDPYSPEAQSAMIRVLKRRGENRQADALREVLQESPRRHAFFVERPEELDLETVAMPDSNPTPARPTIWAYAGSTKRVFQHLFLGMVISVVVLALFPRQPILALMVFSAAVVGLGIIFRQRLISGESKKRTS